MHSATSTAENAPRHEGDRKVPLPLLLERLSPGWKAGSADVARDLTGRWASALGCSIDIKEVNDSSLRFTSELGSIRLRGTSDSHCLLLAARADAEAAAIAFWAKAKSPGKAVYVIALNRESFDAARRVIPPGRFVLLDFVTTSRILSDPSPSEQLKAEIRKQVPIERLIPFDAEHSAEGHMFQGRTTFLRRLANEDTTNFAIAGPSRIGKTSLLKRYREQLVRSRAPEHLSHHYIDLMRCPSKDDDEIARYIVNSVDSSHKNHKLTCDRIELTLAALKERFKQPVGLLLDEVDEYVSSLCFQFLGQAAKKDLCRLVLAGKGELLKKMLAEATPFQCRLHLLRLEPLDDREAEDLLFGPVRDLGFTIDDPDRVRDSVFRWTGKLPHLIQFYGHRICETLLDADHRVLDLSLVERVRDTQETFTYFIDPLFKAKDPALRFIALSMLDLPHRSYRLDQVHESIAAKGLAVSVDQLWDKLNELVILNVLAWNRGSFQVATESLTFYARETRFLSLAMDEARKALGIK